MKRFLPFIIAAVTALPGCGYFTNVPAQIVVADVKPATLVYGEGTTGNTIKIDSPEVTVRTDAGSIGATFNSIYVQYYDTNRAPIPATKLPQLQLGMTARVEGSQYSSNPLDPANALTQAEQGQKVWIGRTTIPLPIVSRHVEEYGGDAAANQAGIWAMVTMKGVDDANFDTSLIFYVPIMFSGIPATK